MGRRMRLVLESREQLIALAREYGATLSITGSVARGEEAEAGERPTKPAASDIDFYVEGFDVTGDRPADTLRAIEFLNRVRAILRPFRVDIYPLPDRVIDGAYLKGFKRDAVSLESLE